MCHSVYVRVCVCKGLCVCARRPQVTQHGHAVKSFFMAHSAYECDTALPLCLPRPPPCLAVCRGAAQINFTAYSKCY